MVMWLVVVLIAFALRGLIRMPPVINDVATDLNDPPQFVKAEVGPLPEKFKEIIRQHYPDLKPKIFLSTSKETVFAAAQEIVKQQRRWSITFENVDQGVIEGVAVTAVFRFRDDFVIRLRQRGSDTVVDMRSRSRIGKGDFGSNAQRIRKFLEALEVPT